MATPRHHGRDRQERVKLYLLVGTTQVVYGETDKDAMRSHMRSHGESRVLAATWAHGSEGAARQAPVSEERALPGWPSGWLAGVSRVVEVCAFTHGRIETATYKELQ